MPSLEITPLPGASFGAIGRLSFSDASVTTFIERHRKDPQPLRDMLNEASGLLVLRGFGKVSAQPSLLVQLSYLFGSEVENYHDTLTSKRFFHEKIPQILVLSNLPPCNHAPPPIPHPPLTDTGELPVRYPHRHGWHTDQSYRRPPPDVSLLCAVECSPTDQGQTLFADTTAAYETLAPTMQRRIQDLQGIHAPSWIGRSQEAVRAGETPKRTLAHQLPQRHPLVRVHPDTGRRALYLCEGNQMDFVDGPIQGLESGIDGEGARLLHELIHHATAPQFTYVHEWTVGDLLVGDNRCLLHAPTWYDTDQHARLMWRTTVMGNAGDRYRGEAKSWISTTGLQPMEGMGDV